MAESATDTFSVIGVDLAADAKDTAYCEIVVEPQSGTARVGMPKSGKADASDEALLKIFAQPNVARIGIDAPFGWPLPFVLALQSHSQHDVWPRDRQRKDRHFASLTLRSTDLHVASAVKGVTPLSVSADWIAVPAMRAALLLSRAPASLDVDRSGVSGHFVEVYPAASFARWEIETGYKINGKRKSYKRDSEARKLVVKHLANRLPDLWNAITTHLRGASDHAVDAFVSALVALMAELDRRNPRCEPFIEPIPAGMEAVAKREGWIALPTESSLEQLGAWLQPSMP